MKKEKEYIYETTREFMLVRDQKVIFRPKNLAEINYLEFHNDFAFNGGGSLRCVIKDLKLHYR